MENVNGKDDFKHHGNDSVIIDRAVGIATGYGLDGAVIESR